MANQSSLALYLGLGVLASALLAGGLLMMKSRSADPPARTWQRNLPTLF